MIWHGCIRYVRSSLNVRRKFGKRHFGNKTYQLIRQQQNRLQRKFAIAKVEQILQTGAKKIKNHGVVVTLRSEPANERNPNTPSKMLVDPSLIL